MTARRLMFVVCLFRGHRYDPTIMQLRPIPLLHCDRCGMEF